MPEQIYTDKDYLDAQFSAIAVQFAAVHQRMNGHEGEHKDQKKRLIQYATLILTAAGIVSGFVSTH